jgi:hypothetical protein
MRLTLALVVLVACLGRGPVSAAMETPWTSPNRYRILLSVDPGQAQRSHSPAAVDLDLADALKAMGERGLLDEQTIEVVAYDDAGRPRVYDESRKAGDRYLLPWRIDQYWGVTRTTLRFVVADSASRQYAVYFDTVESGRGQPRRYQGIVGDGDLFSEGYQKRQIAVSKMDDLCDMDGDGDLDLFKVTNEPFIYCYENVGGNHFVDRGRLTSGGELFVLPHDGNFRSWAALRFDDWDGDGDQDLFVGFTTGDPAHQYQFFVYENTAGPGKPPTFKDHGPLKTVNGKSVCSFWFATMAIADWDGDGKKDILASHLTQETLGPLNEYHRVFFYKNKSSEPWVFALEDGVPLEADGKDIIAHSPRVEVTDVDGDGDYDLFCAPQGGAVSWWKNVGTKSNPSLTAAGSLATGGGHSGIKVADLTGDGLPDCLIGDMWGGGQKPGRASAHTYFLKNVGTRTKPRFEDVDAEHGAPYTEGFQPCDLGRQNTVRAVDWNNDGKTDLIASAGEQVYCYRNLTNQLFPLFAAAQELVSDAGPGSLRSDVCDWNSDGRKDLLVVNGKGELRLYLNEGTDAEPKLGAPRRLEANGKAIEGADWASVMVCDWDKDGKKDVVLGAAGWLSTADQPPRDQQGASQSRGFLFYKNVGTDAEPVLAAPKWITVESEVIEYIRPNLGSFVDWNGDGREDLISCEFENRIWLYLNRGTAAANTEPQLAPGIPIIQPRTVQMVSGACAVDWNRDGDIDIVTGQGHGGSGLRFFERDCIEDTLHNKRPAITVHGRERRPDSKQADR